MGGGEKGGKGKGKEGEGEKERRGGGLWRIYLDTSGVGLDEELVPRVRPFSRSPILSVSPLLRAEGGRKECSE